MRVDRALSQSVEPLGSKPKFWFRDGNKRFMFKAEDRGTGEDWAEVVACHLCELIGLPHVKYELAAEYDGEEYIRPGVVCENMAYKPMVLVLGNQLLLSVDPQYPQAQRFRVRQHTIDAVCDVVVNLAPTAEKWMHDAPTGVESALDVFVGYVMLDAWIANQDRHHENWGGLWDGNRLRLAPTFDHGSAMARNLLDTEREDRLMSNDHNRKVAAFVARGRSALYKTSSDRRPIELLEAFRMFSEKAPKAATAWLDRLRGVKKEQIWSILERVPVERMSDTCKRFTFELLRINQHRIQF